MKDHYSIAIYPPSPIMQLVGNIKKELAREIGWFNSLNSAAHITICEFFADEKIIPKIKSQLQKICGFESAIEIYFDHLENYNNRTFCILPSVDSTRDVTNLMKRIQKINIRPLHKSGNPHISIARQLNENKSSTASQLIKTIKMNFCCDRIVLRILNSNISQYVVVDEFLFQNQQPPPNPQLSLF